MEDGVKIKGVTIATRSPFKLDAAGRMFVPELLLKSVGLSAMPLPVYEQFGVNGPGDAWYQ